MTTLANRPATALLVVDVQNRAVAGSYQRDAVVANIGSLVEKARREHVPVIWIQHSDEELTRGSGDWQIVPELNPGGSEPLVEKHYGDSFEDTTLENVLSGLGVGRLVIVGAQTDACIRSTLHGAFAGSGYRAHEPVLDLPDGAWADGRDGRDQRRRFRRRDLTPTEAGRLPERWYRTALPYSCAVRVGRVVRYYRRSDSQACTSPMWCSASVTCPSLSSSRASTPGMWVASH